MIENAEVLVAIMVLFGSFFSLFSAVGLIRLPDVYTRAHAASKASTLGVLSTLIGTLLFFLFTEGYFSIRLILGIFFVFLTAPVSAHMIGRSAYRSRVPLAKTTVLDELKEYIEKSEEADKPSKSN